MLCKCPSDPAVHSWPAPPPRTGWWPRQSCRSSRCTHSPSVQLSSWAPPSHVNATSCVCAPRAAAQ
eukprot:4579879-Alexandrium_andersonii.AAC.1